MKEIMKRRDAVRAEWMRWVEANRGGFAFFGVGIVIANDGTLRSTGMAQNMIVVGGRVEVVLEIEESDDGTGVRVAYADGRLQRP